MIDLDRLNKALKYAFNQKGIYRKVDMSIYLGYKNPYFSGIINGKEKISNLFLKNISDKLGINIKWLETGEGEMLRSDLTAATDAKDKPTTTEQIAMAMETLVESNKILSESNLKLAEVNTRLVAILEKKEKQE